MIHTTPEPEKIPDEAASPQNQRTSQPHQPTSGNEQLEVAQQKRKEGTPLPDDNSTITGNEETVV